MLEKTQSKSSKNSIKKFQKPDLKFVCYWSWNSHQTKQHNHDWSAQKVESPFGRNQKQISNASRFRRRLVIRVQALFSTSKLDAQFRCCVRLVRFARTPNFSRKIDFAIWAHDSRFRGERTFLSSDSESSQENLGWNKRPLYQKGTKNEKKRLLVHNDRVKQLICMCAWSWNGLYYKQNGRLSSV